MNLIRQTRFRENDVDGNEQETIRVNAMTEQFVFDVYCYAIVGILGNALIAWELGKKGWIRLGLEGPKNKKVRFALYCFLFMMLWQILRKLDSPFTSWRDLWIPAWCMLVFLISHFLVPRSMRIYSRAKFLHETTYTGDWRKREPEVPIEQIRNNWRLLKAKSLYIKALQIQERLSHESTNDVQFTCHQRNVAVTYSQLALLYIQQRQFEKASIMAQKAVATAELLNSKSPNQSEVLMALSDALFRVAEIEHFQGKIHSAKAKYERALAIDRDLRNDVDADITEARLREIAESDSAVEGDE